MARALVVQHIASEDPALLTEWLPAVGLELDVVAAYAGEPVPAEIGPGHSALIVMGGPMAAYDEPPDAAWIPAVKDLLRSAVEAGVPTLGICLGAQLLA